MTLKIWVDNCSFLEKPAAQDRHWHRKGVFNTISLLRENFLWRCSLFFSAIYGTALVSFMSQSVKFPPKRDIFAFIWLQSIPQMPRNGEEGISEAIYRNNALSPVAFHPSPWYPDREKRECTFETTSAGCEFYFTLHSMCTDWHLNKQGLF